MKEELMNLSLEKDSLTETLVGAIRTIAADESATTIRRYLSPMRSVFKLM
jgi:hypothetical protein